MVEPPPTTMQCSTGDERVDPARLDGRAEAADPAHRAVRGVNLTNDVVYET